MFQYLFILFSLIFILSFNPDNHKMSLSGRKGKGIFGLCLGVLILLAGFRSPIVGNDTMNYINIFNESEDVLYNGSRYEIGYKYYNLLIHIFTENDQVFLIITSFLILSTFGFFIWKYSTRPKLALVFFFILSYGMTVNTLRQCFAICFLLFSIECIIQKRWLLFCLLVVVASYFHITAILFLAIYPLSNIKIERKTILMFVMGSVVSFFLFSALLQLAFSYFPMYEYYSDGKYFEGGTRIASIVQLLFSIIIFVLGYIPYKSTSEIWKQSVEGKRYTLLLQLEMIAIFVLFLSLKVNLLDRLAMNYSVLSFVLISNAINLLPVRKRRIVTFSLIMLFASYSCISMWLRPEWNRIFPIELEWRL